MFKIINFIDNSDRDSLCLFTIPKSVKRHSFIFPNFDYYSTISIHFSKSKKYAADECPEIDGNIKTNDNLESFIYEIIWLKNIM